MQGTIRNGAFSWGGAKEGDGALPGQYKVTAKIGNSTQELDVTIDPNGVALKEFVLKK